jgi:hypothetical protein
VNQIESFDLVLSTCSVPTAVAVSKCSGGQRELAAVAIMMRLYPSLDRITPQDFSAAAFGLKRRLSERVNRRSGVRSSVGRVVIRRSAECESSPDE